MLNSKKIIVVLPAFNAAKTLAKTAAEIPRDIIDEIILVDDCSLDNTVEISKVLGIKTIIHRENSGYGANQKTCYNEALECGADIVIMLHPDYQYTPRLLVAMASMIAYGEYDSVLASRILGNGALKGGMPLYKYIANRFLTLFQNILMSQKVSEYHSGYRAFSKEVIMSLPLELNSNDFIFDNQMLAQILFAKYKLGEISCPTLYESDSSSISLIPSIRYGLGVIKVSLQYFISSETRYKTRLFRKLHERSK